MNTSKKIILVPVDFSEQSIVALEHAEVIAKTIGSELILLHVVNEQGFLTSIFTSEDQEKVQTEVWKRIGNLGLEVEKRSGIRATSMVSKGSIYEEVVRVAELTGANFIVMGTNGSDSIRKRFIGSNALRVVRESRVPVITIKGKPKHTGFRRIVLPLDLSKETREKVNMAVSLSRYFQAEIKVVSVLLTDDEEVLNRLNQILNQVSEFLDKAEVKHSTELVKPVDPDNLGQEVVEYTRSVEGDLIMIMTQQETNFTEMFIGSAAQEVINNSDIPVCSIVPNFNRSIYYFAPY